ncbi:uncharacterized protein LOC117238345 [Bombus vosnesenskii]|uniref:Uncharacterized protein LOC117238345 n=1 Tax=Bombus vosnesenskii TaxID=207650 RepID=A0A6J3L1G6_9HYME|nr:uncharacterized protein LOC117238345 [Bombus vosnesenskii]
MPYLSRITPGSFKAKTVSKRLKDSTKASLCLNCLKKGHIARDCHAGSCRMCGGRHHTTSGKTAVEVEFLHLEPKSLLVKQENSIAPVTYRTPTRTEDTRPAASEVLHNDIVTTAQVHILTNKQQPIQCRALLDTGSSMNFITERLANILGIRQRKCSVPIGALDTLKTTSRRLIRATITSIDGKYECTLAFLVIPAITHLISSQPIDRSALDIPRNIKLADLRFHVPSPIAVLLSSGTTLSSMYVGQINLTQPDEPELRSQKALFGWVIRGSPTSSTATNTFHAFTTAPQVDLTRFWEIDEGPPIKHISETERRCEDHFRAHTRRTSEGRYIVALPFNENLSSLGSSKALAMKRLASLNRRFQRDRRFEADYRAVIQDYLDRGHMSKISPDNTDEGGYYLPHHAVIKVASETTKLRVVFDGSAASSTGVSLNDTLYRGSKLQEDLFNILLRFRLHQNVLTGNIEKMYRKFLVRSEDRQYQQIVWRNKEGEIETYQLNTVTFGLSAAPYLALRCLKKLADDEGHRFPRASSALRRDFYVDDALTGADTKEEVLPLRKELTELLQSAGLNIREWASNDQSILQGLSEQDKSRRLQLVEYQTLKTLGIFWDSKDDAILYSVEANAKISWVTKRSISSVIARIYDSLGSLAPVIVRAKFILQRVWSLKVDWDEALPADLHSEWNRYYTKLSLLNEIRFPRKTIIKTLIDIELHGFCDASERAYGACVYLRSLDHYGNVQTRLLTAKSKVAPLKTQTIPRLELSGALLLTSLIAIIRQALHIEVKRTVYWTDSTIVLQWINSSPHTLKTFVANRVAEIQNKTSFTDWRHVPTNDNPAGLISRGQSAEDFLQPNMWQTGPRWLQQPEEYWPMWSPTRLANLPERKAATCLATTPVDNSLLDRFSSWPRELYELLKSDDHIEKVITFLANKQIEWHFIPPHSPHFGGLWEAAVKPFKYHFRRIVGNELFTFEQFNTLVIEIEAVLNSRLLTPISTDPKDLLVLTPGHSLIGE